jgi:signal transduction histidine kinase
MSSDQSTDIEFRIARSRVTLALVALLAMIIDPTEPFVTRLLPISGSQVVIDPYTLSVLVGYLLYSLAIHLSLHRQWLTPGRSAELTTWWDVLFGAAIAFFTEGSASPFEMFFVFAVVVVSFRAGFRQTALVTAVSVALYLSLIVVSAPGSTNFFIMRPVHLAIIGYLVGLVGQERLNLEAEVSELTAAAQRHRIAADLHDGLAQTLAGINLRLETCRELIRRDRAAAALAELTELQQSVTREYDGFRGYMRSLAGLEEVAATAPGVRDARFSVDVQFGGGGMLVGQVLQILREGVSNVLRHAGARNSTIRVRTDGPRIVIAIDDDGVGFGNPVKLPWSISARVRDLGGSIRTVRDDMPGAHLAIDLPGS